MTDPPQPPSSHWTVLSCGLNLLNSLYDVGLSRNSGDMWRPKLLGFGGTLLQTIHEWPMIVFSTSAHWTSGQIVVNDSIFNVYKQPAIWKPINLTHWGVLVHTLLLAKFCSCSGEFICPHLCMICAFAIKVQNHSFKGWVSKLWIPPTDIFLAREIMISSKRFSWGFHIFRQPLRYLTFSSHSIRHGHVIFRSGAYLVPKNIYQAGWPKVRHCRLHPPRLATFRWF